MTALRQENKIKVYYVGPKPVMHVSRPVGVKSRSTQKNFQPIQFIQNEPTEITESEAAMLLRLDNVNFKSEEDLADVIQEQKDRAEFEAFKASKAKEKSEDKPKKTRSKPKKEESEEQVEA